MMRRSVKPHNVRRNELLDTAQSFFCEKGYESTSITNIIEAAGIAKGTFYHYFKSKEDLLDQLVDRISKEAEMAVEQILKDRSLNGLEKLNRYFAEVGNFKLENWAFIETLIKIMFKEQNILLRYKMIQRGIKIAAPKLAKIIRQGSKEGWFDAPHAQDAAEHIMMLVASFNDRAAPIFLKAPQDNKLMPELEQKFSALENSIERILGAPEKSICFVRRDRLNAFIGN